MSKEIKKVNDEEIEVKETQKTERKTIKSRIEDFNEKHPVASKVIKGITLVGTGVAVGFGFGSMAKRGCYEYEEEPEYEEYTEDDEPAEVENETEEAEA